MSDFANSSWQLKMRRANDHLSEFAELQQAYLKEFPPSVETRSWDGKSLVIRVTVPQQPDPYWSVIITDIVHNLRSSLDSLIYAIIENNAKHLNETLSKKLQKTISFPFCKNASEMKMVPGLCQYGDEILKGDIAHYQPFEYINEFVEPHEREIVLAGHPMSILQKLSNRDKHQSINFVSCYLSESFVVHDTQSKILKSAITKVPKSLNEFEFHYEIENGRESSSPILVPEFKVKVEDPEGLRPAYSSLELMHFIRGQVQEATRILEYHLRPKPWGKDYTPLDVR
jgi:hypothetical protein